MKAKTELVQIQALPISKEELEEWMKNSAGADIIHPAELDPVAVKNGEIIGFWV